MMRAIKIQITRITSLEKILGALQRSTSTQNVCTAIACSLPIRKRGVGGKVVRTKDLKYKARL